MSNIEEQKVGNIKQIKRKHYKVKVVKKKQSTLKFIISVLSYSLFVFLMLLGVALLLYVGDMKLRQMKGDNTPPKYSAFVVLTGSMLPEIRVNDVVVIKKTEASELEKGDIITFLSSDHRFEGITVTHRIVDIFYDEATGKYSFQTKGDNNNTVDYTLAEEDNLLGRVIFKIPLLGYLQEILATKGGWIIVILIPCLVIISYDIMKLFKLVGKKTKVIK